MEANQFPAASRSICLIAAGKHTVTRQIQLSKRLCFTCLSKEVIARFSHAHNRTETSRRFASISRLCRRRLTQMSRWRGRGVARRRSNTRLFGNDPRRQQFLKTVAHQQGLLQIYEDFCMQDNSDCAQCPFPEQMRKWM